MVGSALTLAVAALCVRSLPEFNDAVNQGVNGRGYELPTVSLAQGALRDAVRAPAVLLFRYHRGLSPHDEPVYNSDVAWPDDAPVIRAHDLGGRDEELFRYYESRQPGRRFYLFDRGDNALYDLGAAPRVDGPGPAGVKLGPPVRRFGTGQ